MEIYNLLNSILSDSGYDSLTENIRSQIELYLHTHYLFCSSPAESEQNTSRTRDTYEFSDQRSIQETNFVKLHDENILPRDTINDLNTCNAESRQSTTDVEIKTEIDIVEDDFFENNEMFNITPVYSDISAEKTEYKCLTCKESFLNESDLMFHKETHKTSIFYACHNCTKVFTSDDKLIEHSSIHMVEKPDKCEVHYKSCQNSSQLNIHSVIRSHTCDVCSESFAYKSTLIRHSRIHTGEKPYKCNVCNKSFPYKSTLNRHSKIHTGEKSYKCKICNKSFSQCSSLLVHSRTHTGEKPYKCKVCSKSFSCSSHLIRHSRIHTAEKPYKCKVCSKSFSCSSYLTSHSKTHSGKTPFKRDF